MVFVSMTPPAPNVARETEPSTPAFHPSLDLKLFQGLRIQKHDHNGLDLSPELQAKGTLQGTVVIHRLAADPERPFSVLSPEARAALEHFRKHQHAFAAREEPLAAFHFFLEQHQRFVRTDVNFLRRGGQSGAG